MNSRQFSCINRERCESPLGFNHALNSWTLSEGFTATMRELGDAANVAKKLNRVPDGVPDNVETPHELKAALKCELAATLIYLDLLAQSQGIDLSDVVIATFDAKSEQIGYPKRLRVSPEQPHSKLSEVEGDTR